MQRRARVGNKLSGQRQILNIYWSLYWPTVGEKRFWEGHNIINICAVYFD